MMSFLELLLVLVVTGLSIFVYKRWTEYKELPPGPWLWNLPIVGYLPFILFRDPLKVFQGFKKNYGKIFSLQLGNFGVVVINDYKLIMEAYTKDVFLGRPSFEVSMNRNHGRKRGILFAEGSTWAEQRRFALRNLRVFGFGKQTMESLLLHENNFTIGRTEISPLVSKIWAIKLHVFNMQVVSNAIQSAGDYVINSSLRRSSYYLHAFQFRVSKKMEVGRTCLYIVRCVHEMHANSNTLGISSENVGNPVSLKYKFSASVLNSLWYICTGSRFEPDDPDFSFCVNNFTENLQRAELTGVVFFFPWVLKHDLLVKGFWEKFLATRTKVQGLVKTYIEDHKATYDPNVTRDFIDALISQWKKTTDPNSSFYGDEGDLNMLLVLVDLFLAGAETTSSTLQWAMLYMIMYPDVQRKVQHEIDSVIGNRSPSMEDKSTMIYTEATLHEVHRFCSMVPFSVYHSTTDTAYFHGYKIPKDFVVLANLRDAHFDTNYWGDPEVFRPERFINKEGNKIIKHEAFMPFSSGRRLCLGESLAKDTLFIFFTSLLQKFTVEKDPGSEPYSIQPNASTFILCPVSQDILITKRQT